MTLSPLMPHDAPVKPANVEVEEVQVEWFTVEVEVLEEVGWGQEVFSTSHQLNTIT